MFDTLTGSLIIVCGMLGIIAVFALCMTGLLRWLFLTDVEMAETTSVYDPATAYPSRRAA
ncbi:MAG TPA: hypothetical protein VL261_07865 [Nitrospira sp.]|jgi:hypothetical protein|nr:hypothetical protein [Nitrospira sp.]